MVVTAYDKGQYRDTAKQRIGQPVPSPLLSTSEGYEPTERRTNSGARFAAFAFRAILWLAPSSRRNW